MNSNRSGTMAHHRVGFAIDDPKPIGIFVSCHGSCNLYSKSRVFCLGMLSFFGLALPAEAYAQDLRQVVVGYVPEYRLAELDQQTTANPTRFKGITDLVYFGIDSTTKFSDGKIQEDRFGTTSPEKIRQIQELKSHCEARLLLTIGGWGRSQGFPSLTETKESRAKFIQSAKAFCDANGFDGVDYDWEHPNGESQLKAYSRLIVETSEKFRESNMLVTVAQAGWQDLGKEAYAALDRVHLMAYDHDFPQATLEKSTQDVERLIEWGCPPEKIALGLPFYGRNSAREALTYDELTRRKSFDGTQDVVDGFAYNSPATIAKKLNYGRESGLAGVMIWELGQDSVDSNASLLKLILGNQKR